MVACLPLWVLTVTVVEPALTPLTTPSLETVAIFLFLTDQVKEAWVLAGSVGCSARVSFTPRVTVLGFRVTFFGALTTVTAHVATLVFPR